MIGKILFVSADVIAAASYALARFAQRLVDTRLGVRRWLNFHEARLLASVPIDAIARCVSSAMFAFAIYIAARSFVRRSGVAARYASVVSAAACGAFSLFSFFASVGDFRAYYLMLAFFMIGAAVETARGSYLALQRTKI